MRIDSLIPEEDTAS